MPVTRLRGPAVVEERESSCSFGPDCAFWIDEHFNLVIELDGEGTPAATEAAVVEAVGA